MLMMVFVAAISMADVPGNRAPGHHIDDFLASCLAADSTTSSMGNCVGEAYARWDGELNRVYTKLMSGLPAAAKTALLKSQRQWLVYRDAEFATIDEIYSNLQGAMYLPMRLNDRLSIVKSRTLDLVGYHTLISE